MSEKLYRIDREMIEPGGRRLRLIIEAPTAHEALEMYQAIDLKLNPRMPLPPAPPLVSVEKIG